jgi:hypothetical protein
MSTLWFDAPGRAIPVKLYELSSAAQPLPFKCYWAKLQLVNAQVQLDSGASHMFVSSTYVRKERGLRVTRTLATRRICASDFRDYPIGCPPFRPGPLWIPSSVLMLLILRRAIRSKTLHEERPVAGQDAPGWSSDPWTSDPTSETICKHKTALVIAVLIQANTYCTEGDHRGRALMVALLCSW